MDSPILLEKRDWDALLASIQEIKANKPDMTGFARLSDITAELEKIKPIKVDAKVDGKPVQDASLEDPRARAGALGGITEMKIWEIPVGAAVVGGFVAVMASELVDGFLVKQSPQIKGMVKLVAAGAVKRWGSGMFGSTASNAVALLLAYDGVRMLLPLDEWASRLVGGVTRLTGQGLGGKAGMSSPNVIM